MVYGVGAAIALVAVVALLSRLHPSWFPAPEVAPGIDASITRLNYPLDYWNGLGAFIAIGIPLVLAVAAGARTMAARALSCAAIPAMALAGFFTVSRGAAFAGVLALIVLFALHPRRRSLIGPLSVTALGSAILMFAANQRDELTDGLVGSAAAQQGDEMLVMTHHRLRLRGPAERRPEHRGAQRTRASRAALAPRRSVDRRRSGRGGAGRGARRRRAGRA